MNIEKMDGVEKTKILLKLLEWEIKDVVIHGPVAYGYIFDKEGKAVTNRTWPVGFTVHGSPVLDLYDLTCMGLSWSAVNWAAENAGSLYGEPDIGYDKFRSWFHYHRYLVTLPGEQAQATWLDEILRLAIASGKV